MPPPALEELAPVHIAVQQMGERLAAHAEVEGGQEVRAAAAAVARPDRHPIHFVFIQHDRTAFAAHIFNGAGFSFRQAGDLDLPILGAAVAYEILKHTMDDRFFF